MGQALIKKISKFASDNGLSFERRDFDYYFLNASYDKIRIVTESGALSAISKAVREYQNKQNLD